MFYNSELLCTTEPLKCFAHVFGTEKRSFKRFTKLFEYCVVCFVCELESETHLHISDRKTGKPAGIICNSVFVSKQTLPVCGSAL